MITKDTEHPPDGYWVKLGTQMVEALGDLLYPDLTARRKEILAEYLGGALDMAHNSGIKLGKLAAKLETINDNRKD